jgi:hypothetical protein
MTNDDLVDCKRYGTFAQTGTRFSRDPTVWRYMDILSLLSLLQSERLHFTRLEDLYRFDANEGTGGVSINVINNVISPSSFSIPSTPEADARNDEQIARIEKELSVPFSARLPELRDQIKVWDKQNANVFISCWHTNESESDFMWRVYAKQEYGFAVVSSAHALVQSFKDTDATKIGHDFVVYPTADELIRDKLHSYMGSDSAFLIKHWEFHHENEFRVFIRTKTRNQNCDLRVDLPTLVREIRISPLVPDWAEGSLRKTLDPICEKRGIPVIRERTPALRTSGDWELSHV